MENSDWVTDISKCPEGIKVLVTKNNGEVGIGHWYGKTKWLPKFMQERAERTWWVDGKLMLTGEDDDWEPKAWMSMPIGYKPKG